jgi:L-lactate dehydrogenase complex protein LldG
VVEETVMTERDKVLSRVREALRAKSASASSTPRESAVPSPAEYAAVLPQVGASLVERLAAFHNESVELKTDFRLLEQEEQVSTALRDLQTAEGWKRAASHHGALTDAVLPKLGVEVLWMEDTPGADALERCDVGVTECDCLVAQTGSVVVTSRSAGGRALSVLPPYHVVLARREQVVGGLPEAFEFLEARYGSDYPSMMSFITGPSRTGDIERILVLGAHGPRKLTVLCF